jgi:hypothetical protein
MMLVDNSVMSCLCVDVLWRIERSLSTAFYFLVGKVTSPELDNDAPLAIGFPFDRVIVYVNIIIFVTRQSA